MSAPPPGDHAQLWRNAFACGGGRGSGSARLRRAGRGDRLRSVGGAMTIRKDLANAAIASLARQLGKSIIETALGIVRVAEGNMEGAIRAVTSRRGHDPSQFTLVSFGGAGGLHACAIAQSLDIP